MPAKPIIVKAPKKVIPVKSNESGSPADNDEEDDEETTSTTDGLGLGADLQEEAAEKPKAEAPAPSKPASVSLKPKGKDDYVTVVMLKTIRAPRIGKFDSSSELGLVNMEQGVQYLVPPNFGQVLADRKAAAVVQH